MGLSPSNRRFSRPWITAPQKDSTPGMETADNYGEYQTITRPSPKNYDCNLFRLHPGSSLVVRIIRSESPLDRTSARCGDIHFLAGDASVGRRLFALRQILGHDYRSRESAHPAAWRHSRRYLHCSTSRLGQSGPSLDAQRQRDLLVQEWERLTNV